MPVHNPPALYLTFDDGPIPGVTEWVLDKLKSHNARATFFCIGENIDKHPKIFERLKAEGHSVGHHTQSHLEGWKTPYDTFMANYAAAAAKVPHKLFRPPYGRMTSQQANAVLNSGNEIVMWDVLSQDFRKELAPEKCWEKVKGQARNGSIIVFHDSLKAEPRMKFALENTLIHFGKLGYRFLPLPT